MKKSVLAGLFLAGIFLLSAPPAAAQAKEIPEDGNIPLTSEYFPDEWFLNGFAKYQDKNKDGHLSPEEIAAVTNLWITGDLSDFSQIQYFTSLRELEIGPADEDSQYDIWAGNELDLTVFPDLEYANLSLDSRKAPAGAADIRIRVAGMGLLRYFRVCDRSPGKDPDDIKIETIDFQNTPSLETVAVSRANGVVFGDGSGIRNLYLNHIKELAGDAIGSLAALEKLSVWNTVSGFERLDLSKNPALKTIEVYGSSLREIGFAGADALESAVIDSDRLREADVSENKSLTGLTLKCPKLEQLCFSGAASLKYLTVASDRLAEIDLTKNQTLLGVSLDCPKFTELNVRENPGLEYISVTCAQLRALDVGNNVRLERLSVTCDGLETLDVRRNTRMTSLEIRSKKLRGLDLTDNRKLENLTVCCKRLTELDLSACGKILTLVISDTALKTLDTSALVRLQSLELDGMKKLKHVVLGKSKKLRDFYVKNTALKSLDLSGLKKLYMVVITGNKKLTELTHLESRKLTALTVTGNSKLTALDLRKSTKLEDIDVRNNALKTLKLGGQEYLRYLYCQHNKLKVLDFTGADTAGLREVWCDKGVKIKGYQGDVRRF